ncbi:3'-5' exonuclease [bacterium]|nr:MAG: 3'-5' exonuclease [bacterium]
MSVLSEFIEKIKTKKLKTEPPAGINTWSGTVSKDTPINQCSFTVFDTELSGLDVRKNSIISIGAIKMTGGTIHISRDFYRLVKPSDELSRKNVEIHGILPGELEKEEELDEVMPKFLHFITDSVLVGHFVNIDLKFINAFLKEKYNKKIGNPALDTHTLHEWLHENGVAFKKHYHGASGKTDLFSIAQRYGITIDKTHNAMYDAFITAQLFQRFLYFLHTDGMRSLKDLLDVGRA